MARIYVKEVFIRHRALTKIISDRDLRFVVVFQEVFLAEQGVRVATSTVYYLQTDRQMERLNQTLKQYLRHYINHTQNNWVLLLLVIQFTYNITLQEGIQMLLFQANYRYKPRILLLLRRVKKTSSIAKERIKTLINLYKDLYKTAKIV